MSLILEALKKSEAERNRQNGPGLYEMRAAPRRRLPPTGIIAILVVLTLNLVALAWLLLRRPAPAPPAAAAVVAAPTVAAATPAAPPIEPLALPSNAGRAGATTPLEAEIPAANAVTPMQPTEPVAPGVAEAAAAGAGLPELHMSLHAYDADRSRRFILLNGMRLREGDALPDGLRVEQITESGAVINWHGRRFTLPRGE